MIPAQLLTHAAALKEAREALQFYATHIPHMAFDWKTRNGPAERVMNDKGERAKQALDRLNAALSEEGK
jgi:hypothetical protein